MWREIKSRITEFAKMVGKRVREFGDGALPMNDAGEKQISEEELMRKIRKEVRDNYAPESLQEFVEVIKRTPLEVLSEEERGRIAAVMSFDGRKVADLMVPKAKMVFVNEKDFLGPLTLDKLYKSGFTNFPVVDNENHVKGVIHTEELNALAIKKTDRAGKYMTKETAVLHEKDSLEFAVAEIGRTNAYYFLVLDTKEELAGFFTVQMLLDYLLGI